jgi:hypothetical protein
MMMDDIIDDEKEETSKSEVMEKIRFGENKN